MEDDETTSLILESVNAKQQQDQDVLSAEDFAWADSCLIEDPEISDTNMDSLKEALLNILDLHSETLGNPSVNKLVTSNGINDPQNLPSVMEEGTSYTAETSIDKNLPFVMEEGISYTGETSTDECFSFIMEEGSSYTAETSIGEHLPFIMEEGRSYNGKTSITRNLPFVMEEGTSYTGGTSVGTNLPFVMEEGVMEEGTSYTGGTSVGTNLPFVMEEGTSYTGGTSVGTNLPFVMEEGTSYAAETGIDEHVEQESHEVLSVLKQQPFLPNYNDEMMRIQYTEDDDLGFVLSEVVTEPVSDDIFKVWDLDMPAEEDELVKELKEALSSDAGTKVTKGLKMESLDSLIEGLADLSLK